MTQSVTNMAKISNLGDSPKFGTCRKVGKIGARALYEEDGKYFICEKASDGTFQRIYVNNAELAVTA